MYTLSFIVGNIIPAKKCKVYGSGISLGFCSFVFVFGLGGAISARFSLGKRTFPWCPRETLCSLHLGRISCHFPSVFVGKAHVTLGFVEKKLLS